MSEYKHTPGPWKAEKSNNCIAIVSGDYGYGVAKTYGTGKEDTLNARLIAAAPELLEALKLCIPELKEWMRNHGEDIGTLDVIKKAQAAIAKAEGK